MMRTWLWLKIAVFIALGVALGLGIFTFIYARGGSYFSDDPRACVNCHIMNDVYNSWSRSSHHAVATCNACHVPHDFAQKWLAKARNGFKHAVAFTLQNFPEPIRITEANRRTCSSKTAWSAIASSSARLFSMGISRDTVSSAIEESVMDRSDTVLSSRQRRSR
jgi:cytochrome c nitrite reductase small subunit